MTRRDICKIYADIDVLVCPSKEEIMSIVVTEVMMHGKVSIVSNTVGMADYIIDGENGFVFEMGDVHALTKKMEWVFHNQESLIEIGESGRKTYERYFTMDCFGERLEKGFRGLVK